MAEEFSLRGDAAPIELDESGITLVAPGLLGEGVCLDRHLPGEVRALSAEKKPLEEAIDEAGLDDRHTLVIRAPTPDATGGSRGPGDLRDDDLLLQVPLAADESAFVMYVDEAGIVSFHYREPVEREEALPSRAFGADRQDQFRVRLRSGHGSSSGSDRGFFSDLVGKVIKVVVVGLFPESAGRGVARAIAAWEHKHRSDEGLHHGSWEQLLQETPLPIDRLADVEGRRALLFIHGTTSTTAGAFGGLLTREALGAALHQAYGGRLVAFGHQTMGKRVAENVRDFFDALAAAPGHYTFDVICHSRGGLVARALTDLDDVSISRMIGSNWARPPGVTVTIDRIAFVATPNAGTALANPAQIPAFVERVANYVNMLPDSLGTIAASAILATAAALTETTLPRVPGLADQAPGSDLLQALAAPVDPAGRFFAFQSDFQATGGLLDVVKDKTLDRIFANERNDLVVPTDGVAITSSFAVPEDRVVRFGGADGVHHTNFFRHRSIERLREAFDLPT